MKEFWMKRRIISLIIAVLLLMPSAFAMADTRPSATITCDDVRGNVGDTVTAALNIAIVTTKVGQTMDSIQFILTYDSTALEFVGIQEVSQNSIQILGAEYICDVESSTGKVAFTAASADGAKDSGVLMHVRFMILSATSTVLTLRNFIYSFVTPSGTQERFQGGIVNLGNITGQSAPTTIAPSAGIENTPAPSGTGVPTDEPRFPVMEETLAPGATPTEAPEKTDNDILAYIVFVLFIVVAILICVVLTLMIVRRGKNKARVQYFEDDEEEDEPITAPNDHEPYEDAPPKEEEGEDEDDEDDDDLPIQIVRRGKK